MGSMVMKPGRRSEPVDAGKVVVRSVLCIKCGTELRGQSVEGRCPACRHPVYDSVYGAYLIDASPFEPRRLLEMSKIVIYPALFLGGLTGIMVLATLAGARDFVGAVTNVFDTVFFCAMLSPIIALVGAVVFTGRHSAAYYIAKYGHLRFLVAAGGGVVVGFAVLVVLISQFGYYGRIVTQVVFVTVPAAVFLNRLGDMMRRVPNKKLATLCGFAFLGVCGLGVAALLVQVLQPAARDNPDLQGFVIALTLISSCGALALGAGIIRLLYLARRTLRAIAH
jgi:hypothetical protein